MFEHATTENALAVLEEAIKNHGKPASIMTDRGSQFYANASEVKKKGASVFEKKLVELGIKQILAGVRHPQTNGKLERLHGEIQRKLPEFEAIMMRKSDPVDLFMEWYNHRRPHMSLGVDGENETPAHAFIRKMPPRGGKPWLTSKQGRNIMSNKVGGGTTFHIPQKKCRHQHDIAALEKICNRIWILKMYP